MGNKEEYNNEPVFYCAQCLSLKIRHIQHMDNSEYCDECGSTDIRKAHISEWENMYQQKYGIKFIEQ